MFTILVIWSYILVISFIFGYSAVRLTHISFTAETIEQLPFSFIIIMGLCFISGIVGYVSLFIKIALVANLIIFLGAIFLLGFYYNGIITLGKSYFGHLLAIDKKILVILLLSSYYILAISAAPTSSYDTGLYHAQAIRWIEEYPVIPGLGNLHGRLAFNPTWFLPTALFSFSFLKLGPFHVLNGFLLLIVTIMSMTGLSNLIKKQYQLSNILRAGISLPAIFIFRDQLSSPTPDIPAVLLTCAVFIYYLQLQENPAVALRRVLALGIVFLSIFAITIKLSVLPLAFLMVVVTSQELVLGRPLNLLLPLGAVFFLTLPFFLRNIWLSGYLLYPFPGLDLFNLDWKIPAYAALDEKRAIFEFARDPRYLAPPGAVKTPFNWLPYWLPQVLTQYGGKLRLIFLPSLVFLLDWLGQMLKMKTCKIDLREIGKYWVIYLTVAGGLCFLFLTAPDPRFALGYLMVAAIIAFFPFLKVYYYQVSPLVPWSLVLLILYFLVSFRAGVFPPRTSRLWLPAPYPQVALAVNEMQGQKVYSPLDGGEMSWYAPLPFSKHLSKFTFRGDRLEDGFKPQSGR